MKRIFVFMLIFSMFLTNHAFADYDVHGMTDNELYDLRLAINDELGKRAYERAASIEGTAISDIFPDQWIACYIRDELGKFSTSDIVTQDELDTIDRFYVSGQTTDHIQVTTLEGIQYLRNLEKLEVNDQDNISEIPDWVGTLNELTYLKFRYCPIQTVPDCICDLLNLQTLILSGSDINSLPEDIGNLANLKNIDISHTRVSELPSSIYNLSLDTFNREGLDLD